ncbi:RICIN domain-containing protein [Ekhidna sp.]
MKQNSLVFSFLILALFNSAIAQTNTACGFDLDLFEVVGGEERTVIEDPLKIVGKEKILYYNVQFNQRVSLTNSRDIVFCKCQFGGVEAKNNGLRMMPMKSPDDWGTRNIVVDSSLFINIIDNAIFTDRKPGTPLHFDHKNLTLRNSTINGWGSDDDTFFDHALYLAGSEFAILNNKFTSSRGGSAISCRSSGKVIGNTVILTEVEDCKGLMSDCSSNLNKIAIHYEGKVPPGLSNRLVVENNTIYTSASEIEAKTFGAIAIYGAGDPCDLDKIHNLVNEIVIKNNNVTVTGALENPRFSALRINKIFKSPYQSTRVNVSDNTIDDQRDKKNEISFDEYNVDCIEKGYSIKNAFSNRYLKMNYDVLESTKHAAQYSADDYLDQFWRLDTLSSNQIRIINIYSNEALSLDGQFATTQPISDEISQKWELIEFEGGFLIKSMQNNQFLMPLNSQVNSGVKLIVAERDEAISSQVWDIKAIQ